MKIRANFNFTSCLEATLPNNGIFGLVNPDAILQRASSLVSPIFHKALMGAIAQLSLIGVTVKVLNSTANFERVEEGQKE